ncbi:MAG: hypothetical protein QNJ35_01800 [Paracoccaceae bacterium]|nr:hypothetical protein [Paracoccaceae bacterium]
MKMLAAAIALGPGAAFAHGGHVELAGAAHETFHAGPWIGAALIAAALILAWMRERGS